MAENLGEDNDEQGPQFPGKPEALTGVAMCSPLCPITHKLPTLTPSVGLRMACHPVTGDHTILIFSAWHTSSAGAYSMTGAQESYSVLSRAALRQSPYITEAGHDLVKVC